LPRPVSVSAHALARRYPFERQISSGGRRRVETRQRRDVARIGELSRVAVETGAGARRRPVADERTERHGVRVPDAAPQARRDRSAAERFELSAECDNRITCDEYARGI